jgi:hypothetical protein
VEHLALSVLFKIQTQNNWLDTYSSKGFMAKIKIT